MKFKYVLRRPYDCFHGLPVNPFREEGKKCAPAPDTKTHPTTILNYESFVAFETKFDEF